MAIKLVDSYHFGSIIVNGKKYTSDVIIFPERVRDGWFRKVGHQLCLSDITEAMEENPEVLIIGTGAAGAMKVLPEVQQSAEIRDICLIAEATDQACQTYNQLCQCRKVVAALHLTC